MEMLSIFNTGIAVCSDLFVEIRIRMAMYQSALNVQLSITATALFTVLPWTWLGWINYDLE